MNPIPMKYGKTLVVTMSDGTTKTLTGSTAATWAMKLDDLSGINKIKNEDTGVVEYYILNYNACGYCKVATMTPTATEIQADVCEDGFPKCAVTAITVAPTTASIAVGATTKLLATTTPANQNVKWSSSDATKATVNANGVVTGVAAGTATITASDAATGTVTASAAITVTSAS